MSAKFRKAALRGCKVTHQHGVDTCLITHSNSWSSSMTAVGKVMVLQSLKEFEDNMFPKREMFSTHAKHFPFGNKVK
jgi:hypothetical protein